MLAYLIGLFFGFLLCASIKMRKKEKKKKENVVISASEMRRKQQEYEDKAEWEQIFTKINSLLPTGETFIEIEIKCKKNIQSLKDLGYEVEEMGKPLVNSDLFRVYKVSWDGEK